MEYRRRSLQGEGDLWPGGIDRFEIREVALPAIGSPLPEAPFRVVQAKRIGLQAARHAG